MLKPGYISVPRTSFLAVDRYVVSSCQNCLTVIIALVNHYIFESVLLSVIFTELNKVVSDPLAGVTSYPC